MVRALASHQCGPGSTPGPGVICGLSLLLVLVLAPRGLSPDTPVFPSPQKPTLPGVGHTHGHTHSTNQCPAFRCSIFHKLSNLRSGSIFVSLGETFRRDGRNEK